jgi:hypothetical protein
MRLTNTEFHENLSIGSRVVPHVHTNGRKELTTEGASVAGKVTRKWCNNSKYLTMILVLCKQAYL